MKKISLFILLLISLTATAFADPMVERIKKRINLPFKAKKKYRVLCYHKASGYVHKCIPTCNKMVTAISERTGLYDVVFSTKADVFDKDQITKFDAIFFNNSTHIEKALNEEQKSNIIQFVKKGGGLVAMHSATSSKWLEFVKMIGGQFHSHPWRANGQHWAIANEDPKHPIVSQVYQGNGFPLKDELYQFNHFNRKEVRVLLSIDMSKTINHKVKGRLHENNDYPLVWIKKFGKGRVFNSALGHNHDIYTNHHMLRMWVQGIRYVLNDLQVPEDSLSKPEQYTFIPEKKAQNPKVRYRSPQESLNEFQIEDDYKLQLVASEPMVVEPVLCTWDGNGRMYVAQMRTYMQNADGIGQNKKSSQVVRLEDTNHDGVMDKKSIFADNLLLPRMVLPLYDSVLIGETYTTDIYQYWDTNNDGVADKKEIWFKGEAKNNNLEHQHSGLIWAMDNWIYSTYDRYRLRFTNGKVVKQNIDRNGGQWGLTQDNTGLVIYVSAGSERGPVHFQFPLSYMQFRPEWEVSPAFREVWPIDDIPDTQGGRKRLRPDNTLNHFTATCGQVVYRGDALPDDLVGDLLFAEPVGRLIRRSRFKQDKDGRRTLHNIYEKSEFIRSTDPNFRPVNMATGPDGSLYIVDMYRGIIQEGNWTRPGSYLRSVIDDYRLDLNRGKGRIYRVVHSSEKASLKPNMLNENAHQLLKHLSHANGWWRDEAQKLIILKNDLSVVDNLKKMATSHDNELTRLHALWTLEGLDSITMGVLKNTVRDKNAHIRQASLRLTEPFLGRDPSALELVRSLIDDPSPLVVRQIVLSMRVSMIAESESVIAEVLKAHSQNSHLQEVNHAMNRQYAKKREQKNSPYAKGENIYASICAQCHGDDGKGRKSGDLILAPSLSQNPHVTGHKEIPIRILLDGMIGPIKGQEYGMMMPMKANDDEYLAAVLTYVRKQFGNQATPVSKEDVAKIRKKSQQRKKPYTVDEINQLATKLKQHL